VYVGLGLVLFALLPFGLYALGLEIHWGRIVAGLVAVIGALAVFDAWAAATYAVPSDKRRDARQSSRSCLEGLS
jgi:hypothetical protein